MYGDLESMKQYWKQLEFDQTSEDKKFCNGPCFLSAAHLTANAVGAATAIIRDGQDTGGEPRIYLSALTSASDPRFFNPPLYFKKGLYVDVGDNVTSVLVHFLRAKGHPE